VSTWPRSVLVPMLLGVMQAAAAAQELREARWGFDGRVQVGAFNLLSVVVENHGDQPVDTSVVLEKSLGLGRRCTPVVEPCFVAPHSRRLIQLMPFVTQESEEWSLRFLRGPAVPRLPDFKPGAGAVVLLEADARLAQPAGKLRTFPAAWFPATVAATDGLRHVVLDHVPEWDEARRRAFRDWLHAGGSLHLLAAGGSFPRFGGDLAVLDEPRDRFQVGAGTVQRHRLARAQLDLPALGVSPDLARDLEGSEVGTPATPALLGRLQGRVQPEHSWALIFLCGIVFLVLVGPVHGWLSRKRLDWRLSILSLLGVIAAFTLLFRAIGARGYGEHASVHTVGYARDLGNGRWDVTSWTNVFVTSGDWYRIPGGGESALLSTAQEYEAVNGRIRNGHQALLEVDIPLFSSRPFVRRSIAAGPRIELVREPADAAHPEETRIRVVGGLPEEGLLEAVLIEGGRWRGLVRRDGDVLVLGRSRQDLPEAAGAILQGNSGPYSSSEPKAPLQGEFVDQLAPLVVADRFGRTGSDHPSLVLFARAPQAFATQAQGLGAEDAYVVYHLDLPAKDG
jgi:hypothetical protein